MVGLGNSVGAYEDLTNVSFVNKTVAGPVVDTFATFCCAVKMAVLATTGTFLAWRMLPLTFAVICVFLLSQTPVCWSLYKDDTLSREDSVLVEVSSSANEHAPADMVQNDKAFASRRLTRLNKYQWRPTGNGKRLMVVSFLCDEDWDAVLRQALENWSKRRRVFRLTLVNSTSSCPEEGAKDPKIKLIRNRIAVYPRNRAANKLNCASAGVSAASTGTNSSVLYTYQSYIALNRQCYQGDFMESLSDFCWTLGFASGLATDSGDRKSCMGQREGRDKPAGRDFKLLRRIYGKKHIDTP